MRLDFEGTPLSEIDQRTVISNPFLNDWARVVYDSVCNICINGDDKLAL